MMKIDERVLRYSDRDIILVELGDEQKQPMYRSTGRNSGMPKTWLPFDGIAYSGRWFDKTRYVREGYFAVPPELERFGTQEIKQLSAWLDQFDIPEGKDESWSTINEFLSYQG